MTMNNKLYQPDEVLSAVKAAGSALLFCHVSPDGDTLGSALALKYRMERMGKRVQIVVDGFVPNNLQFLPGCETILNPGAEVQPFDTAIAVDVADEKRLGACADLFAFGATTVVIDHHGTNTGYARYCMIDGGAPAVAVVIWRLLKMTGLPLTKEETICLYTAVSTDTGNFIYDSTNAESFAMMNDLMEAGLPIGEYSRRLFRTKEVPFVKLLAQVLPSLKIMQGGLVAGIRVTRKNMLDAGANEGHRDGIVDYAIDMRGVKLAYLASETADGRTKFSLRSQLPYTVDEIAKQLGGGGHCQASGVTLDLPMDEAVAVIEKALMAKAEGAQE